VFVCLRERERSQGAMRFWRGSRNENEVHENSRFAANDTLDSEGIGDDPQGLSAIPRQKLP
jgi:hypothetical protein